MFMFDTGRQNLYHSKVLLKEAEANVVGLMTYISDALCRVCLHRFLQVGSICVTLLSVWLY